MNKLKFRVNGKVDNNIDSRNRVELYRNTSGEIEARDSQKRMNMTADERKNNYPDSMKKNDNVVFSDSTQEFSIKENPKGKYVKADRQVIKGTDTNQWAIDVEKYINIKIRNGKDVKFTADDGDVLTITADTTGKAKFRNEGWRPDGSKTLMSDDEYKTKLNAESHIDELSQISKRGNFDIPDRKNHIFAKDGFNY